MRRCGVTGGLGLLAAMAFAAAAGTARPALAQDGLASVHLGAPGPLSARAGVLPGGDRLFAGAAASGLPGWLRWALSPQPDSGETAMTANLIGQGLGPSYRGLSWSVPLTGGVLHQDDALSFGFSLGHGLGDLTPGGDDRERGLLHGSPFPRATPYLRMGAGLSYQVTPRLGLYVLFDHVAGTGPVRVDESVNDLGMRIGLQF